MFPFILETPTRILARSGELLLNIVVYLGQGFKIISMFLNENLKLRLLDKVLGSGVCTPNIKGKNVDHDKNVYYPL